MPGRPAQLALDADAEAGPLAALLGDRPQARPEILRRRGGRVQVADRVPDLAGRGVEPGADAVHGLRVLPEPVDVEADGEELLQDVVVQRVGDLAAHPLLRAQHLDEQLTPARGELLDPLGVLAQLHLGSPPVAQVVLDDRDRGRLAADRVLDEERVTRTGIASPVVKCWSVVSPRNGPARGSSGPDTVRKCSLPSSVR